MNLNDLGWSVYLYLFINRLEYDGLITSNSNTSILTTTNNE